jgi:hypothetical protein
MSIFGKQTIGTGFTDISDGFQVVSAYANPIQDSFEKLTIYLDGNGPGAGNQVMKAAIWDESAGNPNVLKATSQEVTIIDGASAAWVDFTFAPVVLSSGNYWLGYIAGTTSNTARYGSENINNRAYRARAYASGPSDPFGVPDAHDNFEISVYASSSDVSANLAPPVLSGRGRW